MTEPVAFGVGEARYFQLARLSWFEQLKTKLAPQH